jgi:hypothetical protein
MPSGRPVVPKDAGSTGLRYLEFVHELVPWVSTWQRMQAEHVATADGYCAARLCGRGGCGTPCIRWPCPTRLLADHCWNAHMAPRPVAGERVSG